MADPVLNLDTLPEDTFVGINGVQYQLTSPDGLSILSYRRMSKVMPRLEELLEVADPTPSDDNELQECFDQVCRIVLPTAPVEVLDQLKPLQRVQVYQAFLKLPHETLRRVGATLRQASPPAMATTPVPVSTTSTGSKSRRGSRGSTAKTPSGG